MNKYYCPFAKLGLHKRLYCENNQNALCTYQQYCTKDCRWFNSEKYLKCKLRNAETE